MSPDISPVLLALINLVALSALTWLAWTRHTALCLARTCLQEAEREAATLRATSDSAEARARLMDSVLAALSDGVFVVDAQLRLAGWNPRFSEYAGVPRQALRIGMPMQEIVRLQAEAGEFGLVDPDKEVARRMASLRSAPPAARLRRERPDGSWIELRHSVLPGGGYVTLYTPVLAQAEPASDPQIQAAFAVDWTARLPSLNDAAADGDGPAVRAVAHALRGLAANAGWAPLALTLAAIEISAGAGDMDEVRTLVAQLPLDPQV